MGLVQYIFGSRYMRGIDCLHRDWLLIGCLIVLDLLIVGGYWYIARDWRKHAEQTPDSGGKQALKRLLVIFFFCGISGYFFQVVTLFWTGGWWIEVAAKIVLVSYTLRYAFSTSGMWLVFKSMGAEAKLKKRVLTAIDTIEHEPAEGRNLVIALGRIRQVMAEA